MRAKMKMTFLALGMTAMLLSPVVAKAGIILAADHKCYTNVLGGVYEVYAWTQTDSGYAYTTIDACSPYTSYQQVTSKLAIGWAQTDQVMIPLDNLMKSCHSSSSSYIEKQF